MSTNNEENDASEFLNFDGMSAPLKDEKDAKEKKKFNFKLLIIIGSTLIGIIILIIAIYFIIQAINKIPHCKSGYFFPSDAKSKSESECTKCNLENCDKCSGTKESNICTSCFSNYFPFKENNELIKCNPCEIGEDDKCLSCSEEINQCSNCNIGYKLENGKCVINYSFKATYETFKDIEQINFTKTLSPEMILDLIIDGEKIRQNNKHIFQKKGIHSVYILLDLDKIDSLDNMFSGIKWLTSIAF